MSYVLGIDGGGSKTICVLMDDTGTVLGRGEAGASNYQTIGLLAAQESIHAAIHAAVIEALNLTNQIDITAICLGLAGAGRSSDVTVVKNLVQDLQNGSGIPVTWHLQTPNIVICHDALIALVGGVGNSSGVVAVAGTGSIFFGRNQAGETKRVGGWGPILGDEGSAYKIALTGMQAALKAYDGREMSTRLVEDFKQHLSLNSIDKLVEVIYQQGWGVKEIAALAPIVDNAAAGCDEVARRIVDDAMKDMIKATLLVIDSLFDHEDYFEIVTAGSVWQGKSRIHERFSTSLLAMFPSAKVIFPRHEPAYGAGLLALKSLIQ